MNPGEIGTAKIEIKFSGVGSNQFHFGSVRCIYPSLGISCGLKNWTVKTESTPTTGFDKVKLLLKMAPATV